MGTEILSVTLVQLTQDEYLTLLRRQTDPVKRDHMKACAFPAMYGTNPNAMVLMPPALIEGLR